MSGSLPPGQQAFNGQRMAPGTLPMSYSLSGQQMAPSMSGQMGVANGSLETGGLSSPMTGLGGLGGLVENGQYQHSARPLLSPQFFNQGLPHPSQYSSPNLLHSPLGQLPQQHQTYQQPQHQRFQSPTQQNHMQFSVQRKTSTPAAGAGAYPYKQNGISSLTDLSAHVPSSVPATTSSPTINHLASPLQVYSQQLPQMQQQQQHLHQQQRPHQYQQQYQQQYQFQNQFQNQYQHQFHNQFQNQYQHQQPQTQQTSRYTQPPVSTYVDIAPAQQVHQLPKQPLQPTVSQLSPLPPGTQPLQVDQYQSMQTHQQLQSPQMHTFQQSPTINHLHQLPQAQQPLQQPAPQHLLSPHQQKTPKPAKVPKPLKPQKLQQAKKPISVLGPSPQEPPIPLPPLATPSADHQQEQQQGKQSSTTPSLLPAALPRDSPRISPKGAIQKPPKPVVSAVATKPTNALGAKADATSEFRKSSTTNGISSTTNPKPTPRRTPAEAAALLVCVADECLTKAQLAAPALVKTQNEAHLREYYKLLATGLGCLDTAVRTFKFPPRIEVKMKLRYASILSVETENLMEAETALQSAIATCEKYRLADLKLYVQFLFMKVLFRRKPKAALISIQTHIADCSDRRQTYWTYAFRFLKVFFYLQTSNPADHHALENLHGISALAEKRGDHAVYVLASLLQALALFRTTDPNVIERVQTCMAAASKYQLDESVHIPQLDVLWLLLDLACSLYQKEKSLNDKLNALQNRLEELKELPQWTADACELLLPLQKDAPHAHTISADTSDVLQPGESNDFLVLTSFSKMTAFILGFAYSGLTLSPKQQNSDRKSMDYWTEALKMLAQGSASKPPAPIFLHEALEERRWRASTTAYVLVLMGLNAATHCDWAKVQDCIRQLEVPTAEARDGPLDVLTLYLRGVLKQGQGELNDALELFEDPRLALPTVSDSSSSAMRSAGPAAAAAAAAAASAAAANEGNMRQEVMLLAAMNRLMIMQLNRLRDEPKINMLVEQLNQACVSHPNPEIKTAYSLVMAAITTEPPLSMHDIKTHIQQGLTGSNLSGNAQCLNIALNTMRYRLFENVVGEQALKSAKAGSTQAKKSGNILWMSVADGMLADTYDVMGQTAQAQQARQVGVQLANESWQRTQIGG
ncbi:hypothetical protein SEPCBS119000_002378 [Sporothrix epigloea]|uniref:Cohesin loading factor n=1 Tax=Sporothrix epigloea TaxID=1892477 RepID=A0ABP0DHL8_9PEZI